MPLPDNHQAPQSAGKAGKNPQAPARHCKESLSITLPRNHGFIYKEQRISHLFPLGCLCVTRLCLDSRCPNSTFFFCFLGSRCASHFFSAAELSRRPSLKFFFGTEGFFHFHCLWTLRASLSSEEFPFVKPNNT